LETATGPAIAREGRLTRRSRPGGPLARFRTTRLAGHQLHWLSTGRGPAAVLLHGLCGSHRWWRANIPALAERFRVLALDLPGFGESRCGGPLPELPDLAELVASWMVRAAAAPSHVVGHSMGGHLAIHLAARHPERVTRLVLTDAAGLFRPLAPLPLARWAYGLAWPGVWGDPAFLPVIWRDALSAGPITAVRALHRILRDDVTALLPRIQAPTLVIWGEHDPMIPPEYGERLREAIPDARLHVIRGAYHNPMVDRPDEFNRVVGAFLAGEEAGE
jgi:pimeloyl-ACP methyl ester carboxylesterase